MCDICPADYDPGQEDGDEDGIGNACDNCPEIFNPNQTDRNENSIGDICEFVCGDANGDAATNVGDAVQIINYVFKGGVAPEPLISGDPNCDLNCNVGDAVYLINYVFKGGTAPCEGCE